MGSLDPFKYLPLPTLERFTQMMKTLNLKSYDDVILYSQTPNYMQHYNQEYFSPDSKHCTHLLGLFRVQYLLEAFGHRGNIYIVQNYTPEAWV